MSLVSNSVSFKHNIVFFHCSFTIVAFQHHIIAIDDMEMRSHWLIISNALRIVTFNYSIYVVGQSYCMLINHFVISDYIYFCIRGNKCYAIKRVFMQENICHFYNSFLAASFAIKIEPYGDTVFYLLNSQQIYYFEQ